MHHSYLVGTSPTDGYVARKFDSFSEVVMLQGAESRDVKDLGAVS